MNDLLWFIAFVATPAAVVLGGYVVVLLHERDMKRRHPKAGE